MVAGGIIGAASSLFGGSKKKATAAAPTPGDTLTNSTIQFGDESGFNLGVFFPTAAESSLGSFIGQFSDSRSDVSSGTGKFPLVPFLASTAATVGVGWFILSERKHRRRHGNPSHH
jgi:hypothetical protein